MKRISRLMALLLALMLLSSVAYASETTMDVKDLNISNYKAIVTAAQNANQAVGKTAVTNQDNVEVRDGHYLIDTKVIDTLPKGTTVTITSYAPGILEGMFSEWYGVSYEKDGATKTGYIQTKHLDIQETVPEIGYTPWDGSGETVKLTYAVDGAASYEWQRGLIGEDGSVTWEENAAGTGAELTLNTDLDGDFSALQYTYRCVAKAETGEVVATSERVTLVREDIAAWLTAGEVSAEMLTRALNAPSLDSMVIEGEWLMYVRTGERYAYYNSNTNALISEETGSVLGFVIGDVVYVPRK